MISWMLFALAATGGSTTMELHSQSFEANAPIPRRHTCEGENSAPPLSWTGVPANAKSLALIVDDPDAPDPAAPKRTHVHWVLFGIPPSGKEIPPGGKLPTGTREGLNDWKKTGWGGPCPPIGRHRYFFKLYALDFVPVLDKPDKAQLESAIKGHILAETQLVGTYQKGQSQ